MDKMEASIAKDNAVSSGAKEVDCFLSTDEHTHILEEYKEKILHGRKIAIKLRSLLKEEVKKVTKTDCKITLKLFLFHEHSSDFYIHQILKTCDYVGIQTILREFPPNITTKEAKVEIQESNEDPRIHGILVSFPTPNQINYADLINELSCLKDIDGLSHGNKVIFKNSKGDFSKCMISPTALSSLELIRLAVIHSNDLESFYEDYKVNDLFHKDGLLDLSKYDISVIGKGVSAGKPIIELTEKCGANVRSFYSQSGDYRNQSKQSDIVISAIGRKAHIINEDYLKENAIVIDSGIIATTIDDKEVVTGDVDFDNVIQKVKYISPVPGGVGSLTVIMLLKNLLKAYVKLTA